MPWIELAALIGIIMYIIIKGKKNRYYYSDSNDSLGKLKE